MTIKVVDAAAPLHARAKARATAGRTRRDAILDEATGLFAERGYEGASMAHLAERVGLRKASLFHHFASKDLLYAAVIERLLGPLGDAIQEAVLTRGSFTERLDAMTDALTLALARQPYAARLLLREFMDWGPVLRHTLGKRIQSVLEAAYQFARAGQEAGAFVDTDAKQVIVSLVGALFFPFAAAGVTETFIGQNPFDPRFVEERRAVVREQVRWMVVAKKKFASK